VIIYTGTDSERSEANEKACSKSAVDSDFGADLLVSGVFDKG